MGLKVVYADFNYSGIELEKKYLPPDTTLEAYQCRTEDEVLRVCRDADAIMAEYAPITAKVLRNLQRCRIISNCAIGVDNIDLAVAAEKGIAVAHVREYCTKEVADHTMAMILALKRNILHYRDAIRRGIWDIDCGPTMFRLEGQVLGLVGFGAIAREVAARARGFGLRVLAYGPTAPPKAAAALGVELVRLEQILAEADIISCHLPLTDKTKYFFNRERFAKMKKKPLFVNTARGKVVNEADLVAALKSGQVSGAALDVLEQEPPASFDAELFHLDNVLITPHAAFYSQTALEEARIKTALNVTNFFAGKLDQVTFVRQVRKQYPEPD